MLNLKKATSNYEHIIEIINGQALKMNEYIQTLSVMSNDQLGCSPIKSPVTLVGGPEPKYSAFPK